MKYSVVIPVYGVEKTLEKCVSSVLSQGENDLELILVDDCSSDKSGELCDALAEKYDCIKVIHKEKNEGLGFARNTGLEACLGELILFCDSDDELAPGFFAAADRARAEKNDITVFGVDCVYLDENGQQSWKESLIPQPVTAADDKSIAECFAALNRARIFPFAWNKLYRRDFIVKNGLSFESTKLIEDFLFNIAAFGCAEKIVVVSDIGYRYMRPPHETMVNSYCPEFFDLCKRKYLLEYAFLEKKNALTPDALELIGTSYLKHLITVTVRNRSKKAGLSVARRRQLVSRMLNDGLTVKVLSAYEPAGLKMKVAALPYKLKMTDVCLLAGFAADTVQNKNMRFFKTVLRK